MRSYITPWRLFFLLAPLLLLLWSGTERVDVALDVSGDRCMATLYGRGSVIDCPGLAGGELAFTAEFASSGFVAGPFDWLMPGPAWAGARLTVAGQEVAARPLPAAFAVTAALRHPRQPAGLVLLRPGGQSGYAFIIDAPNRRGAWWQWDGGPTTPLRGIPLDRPFLEQAKPFVRQLLVGWPAAVVVAGAALVARRWGRWGFLPRSPAPLLPRVFRSWSLVPIILFAFALSLHVAVDVLERIPHVQDSVTYLFQAQTLAGGALTAPAPPLAVATPPGGATPGGATSHFEQEFLLVRDGRWFGKYPPGYPAVLAAGVLAGAPWLVNPLLAVLTLALLTQLEIGNYELGIKKSERQRTTDHRRPPTDPLTTDPLTTDPLTTDPLTTDPLTTDPLTTDPLTTDLSLLPALLLAVSPFFLIMSGSLMAHAAELLWATLFMVAWARTIRPPTAGGQSPGGVRWALLAGAALGMLCLTRQFTALTIGLAFGAMHFLKCAAPSFPVAPNLERATHLRRCIARGAGAALAAAPLLLALPLYQAAVTGDALTDPRLLYWPYDRAGFGLGVGEAENAFTMSLVDGLPAITWHTDPAQPPRGHTPARGLFNLSRNIDALQEDLFGWPPWLALSFIWLAFVLRRPAAGDWVLLLVALAVAGGYVAYWSAGIAYGPRYFYAALPALVILSARGISALAATAGRRPVVALLALLLLYSLAQLPARLDAYRGYNFVSAASRRALEATVETPALVFVAASEADWWEYGAFFSGNTPWLDGPIIYARDLGPAENERLRAAFPERNVYYTKNEG